LTLLLSSDEQLGVFTWGL